jgi:predicted ArsR family transcriptional regulator
VSPTKATNREQKKAIKRTADAGIDKGLVKAISHPDRLWALNFLNQKVASPTELAHELGVPVNHIAYHVRELAKYDCIELVDTKPRRGATEHFYRATKRAHFREAEWLQVPKTLREDMLLKSLVVMGEDVNRSAEQGKFEQRADRHWSHTPGAVDEQGWRELQDLLDKTLDAYLEIQAESQERMVASGEDSIRVAVTMMGFEMAEEDASAED